MAFDVSEPGRVGPGTKTLQLAREALEAHEPYLDVAVPRQMRRSGLSAPRSTRQERR